MMSTIQLRNVQLEDAERIALWKQDPYMIQMALDEGYQTTIGEQLNDIKKSMDNKHGDYQIIEVDNKPIGYVRIDFMNEEHTIAWLRFALGEERGKGYMTVALSNYITQLFNTNVHRIEGEVYAYNIPSQRILEKLGFVHEGTKRQAHTWNHQFVDVFVYGLLKEDIT